MDFGFSDDQEALRGLARKIFEDHCTHERLKEVEHEPDRFDHKLWRELQKAGLLDTGELGFVEICLLLEEAGRAVAPVPLWSTLIASRALGRASGDPVALAIDGASAVPAATIARMFVIVGDDAVRVADASEVSVERQETTSKEIRGRIDVARSEPVRDADPARVRIEATAALCAMQAGVCERALRMTAAYTSEREQFDRKLAAFQAVSQRAADAYIDTEAVRLTAWQAVWRLASELPAEREVAVAKFWAAEGAQRVVHAASHLHGGIGVDVDFPLHRYFLWAKQIELSLGVGTEHLVTLGASL